MRWLGAGLYTINHNSSGMDRDREDEPGTHWSENNDGAMSKGHMRQLQGASTGYIWGNLSIKTNNDNKKLLLNKIRIKSP